MKTRFFSLVLTFVTLATIAEPAHAQSRTQVLRPTAVYTPKGFDSNDNAQVVIAGAFSGYCMKVGETQYKIDAANFRIYISQNVTVNGGCSDLAMYIPYSTVINLGALPAGLYDIGALDPNGQYVKMATLPIAKAHAAAVGITDSRVYAPVTSVKFESNPTMANPLLTLSGVLTNNCLSVHDVEVHYTSSDVVEVLPVLRVAKENCRIAAIPYTKTIALKGFPLNDTLIHVRAMNGQSVNKVVTQLDRL